MNKFHVLKPLYAAVVAALLTVACSSGPTRPEGAISARNRLTQLQSDPQLASRAPTAIEDAELAVRAAEEPTRDKAQANHLVLIANRKVDTAWARAQARLLEDQRKTLSEQREAARLEARTREADLARRDANSARSDAQMARSAADNARLDAEAARLQASSARTDADMAHSQADVARVDAEEAKQKAEFSSIDADIARNQADAARSDTASAKQLADAASADANRARQQTDAARADAAAAKQQAEDLRQQVAALNARETDRGLVVTLGDVLFETGRSELKGGSANNLAKLAAFLNRYEDRTVVIEGHTDNVGSDDSNLGLSQRRADSVKTFLAGQGVGMNRLSASGMGEGNPVASNDSVTGRQQNRRVEVIISNTALSSR